MDERQVQETIFEFKNYWAAAPLSKARKRDWDRTWLNWCNRNRKWKEEREEKAVRPQMSEMEKARLEVLKEMGE